MDRPFSPAEQALTECVLGRLEAQGVTVVRVIDPTEPGPSLDPTLAHDQRERAMSLTDRIVAMTPEEFRAWRENPPAWLAED